MIPPILHQTWKNDRIPERFEPWVQSWQRHNPGWTRMFWTDRMLVDFVARHYPDFLATFCSYQNGVMRADAGRYLLMHHFGGVYADLDCECVAPFEPLMAEDRIVLCKEPPQHLGDQPAVRGLPFVLFNGTIVSPPGHPFWLHLLSYLPSLASAKDVLDATGPYVLTSACRSYADKASIRIEPAALFAPLDRDGAGDAAGEGPTLSVHHWAGTWWTQRPATTLQGALKRTFYGARYLLTRGRQADAAALRRSVAPDALAGPLPAGGNVAILVPLRDAAAEIGPFLAALGSLDYPREKIKLVFCEGDSVDGSWEVLRQAVEPLRPHYRDVVLLQKQVRTGAGGVSRARPRFQRARRAGIAKVRNHLIRHGLDARDDWALWIDIDMWKFPADIVDTLIGAGARIVAPNCVKVAGGTSFDMNSFVQTLFERDYRYYRSVVRGIYQPPAQFHGRLHLSDVRHLDRIGLHGVGGTMLLVDAALHRGGLEFPEKPYKDLIETEAFGVLARDLGVIPVGLPRVEVFHVPW